MFSIRHFDGDIFRPALNQPGWIPKLPETIDFFGESEVVGEVLAVDQALITRLHAVYWTFPAEGRAGLSHDIQKAEAESHTVELQRVQVRGLADRLGVDVVTEIALQFGRTNDISADGARRLADFQRSAGQSFHDAVVKVHFPVLNRWRPNTVIEPLRVSRRLQHLSRMELDEQDNEQVCT